MRLAHVIRKVFRHVGVNFPPAAAGSRTLFANERVVVSIGACSEREIGISVGRRRRRSIASRTSAASASSAIRWAYIGPVDLRSSRISLVSLVIPFVRRLRRKTSRNELLPRSDSVAGETPRPRSLSIENTELRPSVRRSFVTRRRSKAKVEGVREKRNPSDICSKAEPAVGLT